MKCRYFLTITLVILVTFSCRKSTTIPPKVEEMGKLSISIIDSTGNKFDTTIQDKFGIDTSDNVIEFLGTLSDGTGPFWIYSWRDSLSLFDLHVGKNQVKIGVYSNTMTYTSPSDVNDYNITFLLNYPMRKGYSLTGNSKGVLTITKVDSTFDSRGKKYKVVSGKWSGSLRSQDCNCEVNGQITILTTKRT